MGFFIFELVQVLNFSLNWQFWVFGPNLPKKGYFQSKTEQAVQRLQALAFCVVNFKSTVVFEHFEDLKIFIILNILK